VPETVLQQERHACLAYLRDSSTLESVFYNAFSGRPLNEGGGGGFGRMFTKLAQMSNAALLVRSGRGWISTERLQNGFRRETYSYGVGTQVNLTIKLAC
jgi:hypothetical protein